MTSKDFAIKTAELCDKETELRWSKQGKINILYYVDDNGEWSSNWNPEENLEQAEESINALVRSENNNCTGYQVYMDKKSVSVVLCRELSAYYKYDDWENHANEPSLKEAICEAVKKFLKTKDQTH